MKTSLKNRGFVSLIGIILLAVSVSAVLFTSHKVKEIIREMDEFKTEQEIEKIKTQTLETNALGASLPSGAPIFETSLASAITSTDTSLTLVLNSVRGGGALSGWQCFTVDEGKTTREDLCGTISGTTVSGLVRGIDPLTATTTNAVLKFQHRVGAQVKQTDFPLIQIMRNQLNGSETLPNLLEYTTGCSGSSKNTNLCNKGYIDGVAIAGASDANDTTKGIVETATGAEAAAGTSLGSTGARLALGSNIATSTCQNTSGASVVVASTTTGKIDKNCIDQTANYNFTGQNNFQQASSTGISTRYLYVGGTATSSISSAGVLSLATTTPGCLQTSSTGTVYSIGASCGRQTYSYGSTTAATISTAMTGTDGITIPVGVLTSSSTISVKGTLTCVSGGSNANNCGITISDTDGNDYVTFTAVNQSTSNTGYLTFDATIMTNGTLSGQRSVMFGSEYKSNTSITTYGTGSATSVDWTVQKRFIIKVPTTSASGNSTTVKPWVMIVNP